MKIALLASDTRDVIRNYTAAVPSFGTAPEALIQGFQALSGEIEVHVISCLQKPPVSSPRQLANNIYYHGLHVPNIGWMKTGYQGCVRAVRGALRHIQPSVVHGQGTERDCAVSAALSGYPSIVTVHGVMRAIHELSHDRSRMYYCLASRLEAFALRRTRGVIAISPYVNALVAPLTPRTWFIPNALQSFFLTSSSPQVRRVGRPRLVNVGVISPRKRQLELLEHLAGLRKDVDFEVVFVGKANADDSYADRFVTRLRQLNTDYGGFTHRVFLSNDEFLRIYDDSDAMIHFSKEESFGLTFAEALARNLPLFASDVGAIRQIAEGIPICRIFPPDDFNGLVSSLHEWLKSGSYLHPRGPTPNDFIASRYHPKVIATRHLAVYKTVVGTP